MTVWRFIQGRGIKHALWRAGVHTCARCGVSPVWYDHAGWRGSTPDEAATLDTLQPCKRCVASLAKESA